MLSLKQAREIIAKRKDLQRQLKELKPSCKKGDFDFGFTYGNFFNGKKQKDIVIEWLDGANCCECVVRSLEKAIVIIDMIEESKGHLKKSVSKYESVPNPLTFTD